jgi:type VI protein secretion system component VasF
MQKGRRTNVTEREITQLQEQIKTLFNDVSELKTDMKEIKDQLTNRLPPWATLAIASLTAAVGWLVGN